MMLFWLLIQSHCSSCPSRLSTHSITSPIRFLPSPMTLPGLKGQEMEQWASYHPLSLQL